MTTQTEIKLLEIELKRLETELAKATGEFVLEMPGTIDESEYVEHVQLTCKGKLMVYSDLWGDPRLWYKHEGKKVAIKNLEEARKVASRLGLRGIFCVTAKGDSNGSWNQKTHASRQVRRPR